MNIYSKTVAVYVGLTGFALVGCDQLSESIIGRPNPNAVSLAPAGPNETTARTERMTNVETSLTAPPTYDMAPSPFVTPANAQELLNNQVAQVVSTGGPGFDPTLFAPTTNAANSPAGVQVPPAERTAPSADGKIRISSAQLKYVRDQNLAIAAQADGLIMALSVDEGNVITANTLLIQLDDRLAKSELEVTNKEYLAALEKSKDDAEIKYSQAAFEVAKQELDMAVVLDKRGSGSISELIKKELEATRAELAINVAQQKNKQDVAAADVAFAKKGASEVQIQLRKITAPFDGIVAEKVKARHDWVRAGDVILRLVSLEQLRVVGHVRPSQLSAAPHELVGAPATVEIEIYPGRIERVSAQVGFVAPEMEGQNGYSIWLQIPNIKSKDQWVFREGMPAKIEIQTR